MADMVMVNSWRESQLVNSGEGCGGGTIAAMMNQSSGPKLLTTQVRMTRREDRMMKARTVMETTVAAKRVPASEAAMAGYGWVHRWADWTGVERRAAREN